VCNEFGDGRTEIGVAIWIVQIFEVLFNGRFVGHTLCCLN